MNEGLKFLPFGASGQGDGRQARQEMGDMPGEKTTAGEWATETMSLGTWAPGRARRAAWG